MRNPTAVLVVDDHPDLLKTVESILQRGDFHVTCTENGKDALDRLRRRRFEVVLTDIFMPDVDGTEIIAAARETQPDARVIAFSGGGSYMSSPDALKVAVKLGADVSLPKPFTPSQLIETIRGVLNTARA